MATKTKFRCSVCPLIFTQLFFAEGHERASKHEVFEIEVEESPVQEMAPMPTERDELRDALAEVLGDVYVCSRVWEAWNVGTMTQDDFSPASEDEDLLDSLIEAIKGRVEP